MKLEVFDPPMCCSSGACGPEPDEQLIAVADLLDDVTSHGITVERYNPGTQPEKFVSNKLVRKFLAEEGAAALPLMLLDGQLIVKGFYPGREELFHHLRLPAGS